LVVRNSILPRVVVAQEKTGLKISPVETFDNLKFSLIGVGVLSI